MFMRLGFADITLQLEFKERLCLRLVNIAGGAVAVSARNGISGKNALTAARSLNSFLNDSPLNYKKQNLNYPQSTF